MTVRISEPWPVSTCLNFHSLVYEINIYTTTNNNSNNNNTKHIRNTYMYRIIRLLLLEISKYKNECGVVWVCIKKMQGWFHDPKVRGYIDLELLLMFVFWWDVLHTWIWHRMFSGSVLFMICVRGRWCAFIYLSLFLKQYIYMIYISILKQIHTCNFLMSRLPPTFVFVSLIQSVV